MRLTMLPLYILIYNLRMFEPGVRIAVCVLRWFELLGVFLTIFAGYDRTLKF